MHPLQKPTPGKPHSPTTSQSRLKPPEGHHEAPSQEVSEKVHHPVRHDSEEHAELETEGHHDGPNKQHVKLTIEPAHGVEQVPPEKEHPEPQGHKYEAEPDKDHKGGSDPEETKPHDTPADTPPQKTEHTSPATILRNRPFYLRIIRADRDNTVQEIILSQSLDSGHSAGGRMDATSLTLAALRKQIHHMYPRIEQFCTPSRAMIHDESISIVEYLELEGVKEKIPTTGTPTLDVYIHSTKLAGLVSHVVDSSHSSPDTATDPKHEQGPRERDSEDEAPKNQKLGDQAPKDEGAKDQDHDPKAAPIPAQDTQDETTNTHDAETLKAAPDLQSQIDPSKLEVTVTSSKPGAGDLSETQWATVLRNCAVFYGWIIDHRTNRVTRAPKPAFQLRSKVHQEPESSVGDFASPAAKSPKTAFANGIGKTMNNSGSNTQAVPKATNVNTPITTTSPKSTQGIPNFQINDDCQIEITAHQDNLTEALTKNDFSGQSTDGSVSAGAYGVSVGVSAGHGSNNDKTTGNQRGTRSQTLVARYLLPRCDIVLWPDEVEPTPELAGLIEAIRRTKKIKTLQRLHAEYGNYFSQRVTLGGRLLSSKVLSEEDAQHMDQQKQSFRTSVGTSVSGNIGIYNADVSISHKNTSGDAHTNENSRQTQNEACVFEAVGGETILATNPKEWCPTVADYKLWRVINRGGLSPLSEMLSGIPGFEAVPSWFVRAVPALSRYITLDEDHGCKARFRVMSPTDALSKKNSNGDVSFYLDHDPNKMVKPQLNELRPTSLEPTLTTMFQPSTYQAPAILGYENFQVGNVTFGTDYNAEFVMTEWDIIAPFDKELKSGTRVILRSCPFNGPGAHNNPTPSHMVVFRSVQGEFLPAMSDSSDYQYWRILKTDAGERHIKPGDNIRLCWDFRDQTAGWRDFTEDVFGRREVRRPADVLNPLFIKVPRPRSDDYEIDSALLMSAEREDNAERFVKVNTDGKDVLLPCRLQHLQLRIDSVGNGGHGDAADYLLKTLEQPESEKMQRTPPTDTNKSFSPPAPQHQGYLMRLRQVALLFGL